MSRQLKMWLRWSPRVLAAVLAGAAALLALDAFDGRPVLDALPDFGMHLLPSLLVLAVLLAGWRAPWAGAVASLALAVAYATMVPARSDWIVAVSGPLALVALLFA